MLEAAAGAGFTVSANGIRPHFAVASVCGVVFNVRVFNSSAGG
jgi:hypothetical protein